MPKIFSLDFPPFKRGNGVLVHCHGVYDVLHPGHLRHLQEAKSYGDLLCVTITADSYVNKGNNRPIFSATDRAEMLAGLECVDYVAINDNATATKAIYKIRPDVFVKGVDYIGDGIIQEEKEALEKVGAKLFFTKSYKLSTTEVIERCKRV